MKRLRTLVVVHRNSDEILRFGRCSLKMRAVRLVGYHAGAMEGRYRADAIGSRDWNLGTDWLRWTFLAGGGR